MDQAQQLRNIIKLKNQNIEQPNNTARVITVTSGKGGVGKSNISVNLAIQLSKLGKKVIIFDADFGLANVEVMFGSIPKYNLSDVIYKSMHIREIITVGPFGIGFISGGSGIVGLNNLTREQIQFLIQNLSELDSLADIIIIDTGAGIADNVLSFALISPEVILVTTPEPSSLTDSYSLLKALYKSPNYIKASQSVKLIANKAYALDEGTTVYEKLNMVVEKFLDGKIEFLGAIPHDMNIEKAVRKQQPISISYPNSKATKVFENLANLLMNNDSSNIIQKRGMAHLFSNFINKKVN